MNLTTEEINELLKTHQHDQKLIQLNYFIRLLMAKIIETLILTDRYLFLLENNNAGKVFLVKVFDPLVSPRNYCLIAIKE